MAVVLVVILLCVVSQIAMIIKFFCMCGDIKAIRIIAKRFTLPKTG